MFEVPVDAMYIWLGVAAVSVATFGVVAAIPTTAPPDPTVVADAVDRIAVGPSDAHATRATDADEIRLGPHRLSLRNDGGSASVSFAYGPVTPVLSDDRLELLLYGHPPAEVFETKAAFRTAVERAQSRGEWRPAPAAIEARHVVWGETDVTLVG
jgi:hypothetical protein